MPPCPDPRFGSRGGRPAAPDGSAGARDRKVAEPSEGHGRACRNVPVSGQSLPRRRRRANPSAGQTERQDPKSCRTLHPICRSSRPARAAPPPLAASDATAQPGGPPSRQDHRVRYPRDRCAGGPPSQRPGRPWQTRPQGVPPPQPAAAQPPAPRRTVPRAPADSRELASDSHSTH